MSQLLPYETIVKASEGDPEAVAAVLSHYAGYIRACSKMDGHINVEMQEHIIQKLIESLFKFRFDRDNWITHRPSQRHTSSKSEKICCFFYALFQKIFPFHLAKVPVPV
mgnify:CR=1 FL=1